MSRAPKILVFDSGLGGLTVFVEILRLRPDAEFLYAADEAGFPYGALPEAALAPRVLSVMRRLIETYEPDVAVIACNTASTLVLPHLRAAFPGLPFVGTVPAIKPAAIQSRAKIISVLATPGTVARDYTRDLMLTYAADCSVTLVGSTVLASLAENFMQGDAPSDAAVLREIAPAFVEEDGRRTDCIALACTHYPLLIEQFERLGALAGDLDRPGAGDRAPDRSRPLERVGSSPGFRKAAKNADSSALHGRRAAGAKAPGSVAPSWHRKG